MNKIGRYMILCAFTIIIAAVMCLSVLADNTPSINVSSSSGKAGSAVDITVGLADNPGIVSMLLTLDYDKTALKLTKVTDAGTLGANIHGNNISKIPYILCWANDTASSDFTVNGTIVKLTFEILSDAKSGNYPITLSYDYDNADILNHNLELIKFDVNNGSITVEKTSKTIRWR